MVSEGGTGRLQHGLLEATVWGIRHERKAILAGQAWGSPGIVVKLETLAAGSFLFI